MLFVVLIISSKDLIYPKVVKPIQQVYINDTTLNQQLVWEYICKTRIKHPKVLLSQVIVESNLKSDVFKKYNNLIGMKKSYQRTSVFSEKDLGTYKYYSDWKLCVIDYALWQCQLNNDVSCMNDLEYINYISSSYAEDSKYKEKLIQVYNNLTVD